MKTGWVGEGEREYSQDPHLWAGNRRNIQIVDPQRMKGPGPILGFSAQKPQNEQTSLPNIWLWTLVGTLLLKGMCKISHTPSPSSVWKEPESDLLAGIGESPGEVRGNRDPAGNRDAGIIHFGGPILLWNTVTSTCSFGVLSPVH